MSTSPLIRMRAVERRRGDGFRLRIECLELQPGEQVALVGGSGSGKSTCLDLMALALRPDDAGTLEIGTDEGIADAGALWQANRRPALAELRARRFGYVLQTGGLAPFLSLQENAMLSRRLLGMSGQGPIPDLARQLGISELLRRKPRQVSIGERQRAAVVRALAHGPGIVLADEPTASLDQSNAEEVMRLLTVSAREAGAALVIVTHDRDLASKFGLEAVECHHRAAERTSIIERVSS